MSVLRKIAAKIRYGLRRSAPAEGGIEAGALTVSDVVALLGSGPRVVLEIGANNGSHTSQFAAAFPDARIYAFEPDDRAWARLEEVAETHKNIHAMKIALSGSDGVADFYCSGGQRPGDEFRSRDQDWHKSGSLCQPTGHLERHPWCKFENTMTVQTRSLDSLIVELGIDFIDFIWMDVQGAEGIVLEGASSALSKTRYLYTEYSNEELYAGQPNLERILQLAEGFEVARRFPGDVLLCNKNC